MALSGNTQSVFKTTEARSGNYACEMIGTKVNNKPGGVFVPNYVGSIFVGKQILVNSYRGFPYTYKPNKFEFWYKYKPIGIDTANAFVALTKWNTNLNKRDTIAIGNFLQSNTDSASFTKASITLNYFDTSEPDTAIIVFSAITNTGDHAGSKFIIDDLEFTGGNVGISDIDNAQAISIFPNPSSDKIYIDLKENAIQVKINLFNELGQKVLEEEQNNKPILSISTQNLPDGIYFILIEFGKSTITRKIVIGR
jgi:hypothetical protein